MVYCHLFLDSVLYIVVTLILVFLLDNISTSSHLNMCSCIYGCFLALRDNNKISMILAHNYAIENTDYWNKTEFLQHCSF